MQDWYEQRNIKAVLATTSQKKLGILTMTKQVLPSVLTSGLSNWQRGLDVFDSLVNADMHTSMVRSISRYLADIVQKTVTLPNTISQASHIEAFRNEDGFFWIVDVCVSEFPSGRIPVKPTKFRINFINATRTIEFKLF